MVKILEDAKKSTWRRNRVADRIIKPLHQLAINETGLDFFAEEWDNLIILDACRADLFEETLDISQFDSYKRVRSLGSATSEWCKETLAGRAFLDTVYVTANPSVTKHADATFAVYKDLSQTYFDRNIGTVPPEPVTETALEARKHHPDRRLVVHYMQPHYPFVTDPEMRFTQFDWGEGKPPEAANSHGYDDISDVWEAVGLGILSREEAWDGYQRNLECVFDEVQQLIDGLDGKTVITSDHGNILGERSTTVPIALYGHMPGIVHDTLRSVPWGVISSESSRELPSEPAVDVEGRLKSLGYR